MVLSAYLRLLISLPAIFIPACAPSSPTCHMMYSACRLNNQGDNIQPWCTLFPDLESVCCSMSRFPETCIQFLRRQVRWSGISISKNFPQFVVIHTVKGFGIVNKAEIDVSLELSSFFHGPADVGNFISGSSAFSKTSLNIWKFSIHLLVKHGLENF